MNVWYDSLPHPWKKSRLVHLKITHIEQENKNSPESTKPQFCWASKCYPQTITYPIYPHPNVCLSRMIFRTSRLMGYVIVFVDREYNVYIWQNSYTWQVWTQFGVHRLMEEIRKKHQLVNIPMIYEGFCSYQKPVPRISEHHQPLIHYNYIHNPDSWEPEFFSHGCRKLIRSSTEEGICDL